MNEHRPRRFRGSARRQAGWSLGALALVTAALSVGTFGSQARADTPSAFGPGSASASARGSGLHAFDEALERLGSDSDGARESAHRAAAMFEMLAADGSLSRTDRAVASYNAGSSHLLAGNHARAVLLLRRAELLAPVWERQLRANVLTNLDVARRGVGSGTAVPPHSHSRATGSADPERGLVAGAVVWVPTPWWLLGGGVLILVGSGLGVARFWLRIGPRQVWCLGLCGLGLGAVTVAWTGERSLASRAHAVAVSDRTLPRLEPDEVLGSEARIDCPPGTELLIIESIDAEPDDAGAIGWVRVRRLRDHASSGFWLPVSAIERVEKPATGSSG